MEHLLVIALLILSFVVVVAAAVWLACRMSKGDIDVGDSWFFGSDFESVDKLIVSKTPEKWNAFIDFYDRELADKLNERRQFDVLKDLLWYLDTRNRLKRYTDTLLNSDREKHPTEEKFAECVNRLTAKQAEAMIRWTTTRISEAEAKFLYDLLRKRVASGDQKAENLLGGGGESGTAERGGLEIPRDIPRDEPGSQENPRDGRQR